MTLTTARGGFWWGAPFVATNNAPAFTAGILDASGEAVAFIIRVPKTGTLDTCEFALGTVANNPDNGLRISFQDVGTSFPDNTQDQFRTIAGPFSTGDWVVPGLITSDGTDTGSKRSVTAGDLLAIVVEFESFTTGDDIDIAVTDLPTNSFENLLTFTHYQANRSAGGTWTAFQNAGPIALKYDDGYYPIGDHWLPIQTLTTISFASTNVTADERALRFQVPVAMSIDGCWVRLDLNLTSMVVTLYDASDTVLASVTVSGGSTTGTGNAFIRWAPVSLSANTTYRLSFKPTSTTAINIYEWSAASNALLAAAEGGIEWYVSTRVDAGSWTDVTTDRIWCGLHVAQIEAGGGGESAHVFLS